VILQRIHRFVGTFTCTLRVASGRWVDTLIIALLSLLMCCQNCLYSHDYRPTAEALALLRKRVTKVPCPHLGKGNYNIFYASPVMRAKSLAPRAAKTMPRSLLCALFQSRAVAKGLHSGRTCYYPPPPDCAPHSAIVVTIVVTYKILFAQM
jgi:hypothetical protein